MNRDTDSRSSSNTSGNKGDDHHGGQRIRPAIWWPLGVLVGSTVLILLFDLDLRFQRLFFSDQGGWPLGDAPLVQFLYHYGTWLPWALCAAALFYCLACIQRRDLRKHFRAAIFLVLVMGVGPGLIVNAVFKANFGRPRPRHVEQFGREKEFLPLLHKGVAGEGSAFPSGHAATAFYLMSPYFILLGRNRRLARIILILGIVAGCVMGLARIAAGAHFLGDILWAWGFVYLTGYALFFALKLGKSDTATD